MSNKIKVYWDDSSENYSHELKNRAISYFSKKYNVDKSNVKVVFRAIKKNEDGETIDFENSGVENIMDTNYQRKLMEKWLDVNEKKVDFKRIVKLDNNVNGDVNFVDDEKKHRRWSINSLHIDNFLCFGDDNEINLGRYKGLNLVNSEPKNQGGKTSFNIDAIKFLLYGTTTKTVKNEEIFNKFTDKNKLSVKGEILISSRNIVIDRVLTRKEKKSGGYTITNSVNYYEKMPDGSNEELKGEDATQTTSLIRDFVGTEEDFDITTLATANNLEDLISMKPAANGKLLNRFIGLEILDKKLVAVRDRYNKFNREKLGNHYNVVTLKDEVIDNTEKIETLDTLKTEHTKTIEEVKVKLGELMDEKDVLLSNKVKIDDSLINTNVGVIEREIQNIKVSGKEKKEQGLKLKKELKLLSGLEFDEDKHHELTKKRNELTTRNEVIKFENSNLLKTNNGLENDSVCVTCKRPLEDVDNASEIEKNTLKIEKLKEEKINNEDVVKSLEGELNELNEVKVQIDKRDRLELSIDRVDVEIASLVNGLNEKTNKLTKYNDNKKSIDSNIEIDKQLSQIRTKISVEENRKDETNQKINNIINEVALLKKDIADKELKIKKIINEEEVERLFKLYIEMYGKKGIGKMVLKSILPIINAELYRLMEDICDFTIELEIDSKNDINYIINHDGMANSLKSGSGLEKTIASLALRAVLGKMAYLPMPNFITFDEVLGKVAPDNLIKLEDMFNKIKELYDMVFLITHNDLVKDWADNIITVKKDLGTNIASLNLK